MIESNAFFDNIISRIFIPSNLDHLEDGWRSKMPNLVSIEISPENKTYCYSDDKKMVFGKSNGSEFYNEIVFVCLDVQTVKIPSFIEIIGDSSFSFCEKLDNVQFPSDTKLREIKK